MFSHPSKEGTGNNLCRCSCSPSSPEPSLLHSPSVGFLQPPGSEQYQMPQSPAPCSPPQMQQQYSGTRGHGQGWPPLHRWDQHLDHGLQSCHFTAKSGSFCARRFLSLGVIRTWHWLVPGISLPWWAVGWRELGGLWIAESGKNCRWGGSGFLLPVRVSW